MRIIVTFILLALLTGTAFAGWQFGNKVYGCQTGHPQLETWLGIGPTLGSIGSLGLRLDMFNESRIRPQLGASWTGVWFAPESFSLGLCLRTKLGWRNDKHWYGELEFIVGKF